MVRVVLWPLTLYIVFLLAEAIIFLIRCKKSKKQYQTLSASKNIHCIASFLSAMTATALCLNLLDFDSEYLWFYALFGAMTLLSIPLMLCVLLWRIEYTNDLLIYRNFLGIKREFSINDIWFKNKDAQTIIMAGKKRVTDYTFLSVNIFDAIRFEAFVDKRNARSSSKKG